MRRARKIALWTLGVLVTLALLVSGWVTWSVRRAFPEHDGTLSLPGLSAEVTVYRDEHGIPQVYGKTLADVLRAQGYVHAQDRFWEMDFRRHVTAGRISEIFGAGQLDKDKYLRTMGWRRVAEQEIALLSPDTKAALEAYAEGVNAWLKQNAEAKGDGFAPNGGISLEYTLLGLQNSDYVIEKWVPADSLAWLKAMAWDLRGNMEDEIRREALKAKGLSREQIEQLYPAYPFDRNLPIVRTEDKGNPADAVTKSAGPATTGDSGVKIQGLAALEQGLAAIPGLMGNAESDGIGSNSWVISGKLTSTGKPILANDPHLSPSQPGIWYQMGLHCECDYQVAGFTFSGVPGVVIGHNAKIAWGFTNLGPDVIDMYLEKLDQAEITSRQEVIKVAGGSDVTITVRSTKHGPLLSDVSEDLRKLAGDYGVAMRWTALDPGRTGDALFVLNTAKGWSDFRKAASLFEVPAQNMIYADVDGNIGYQSPGKIPMRGKGDGKWFTPGWDAAYDWQGYIPFDELPSSYNPDRGYIVTANQAVIGPRYGHFLTDDWSYGYRSQRINDMIAGKSTKISVEDIRQMQFDNRNGFAPVLIPQLLVTPRTNVSDVDSTANRLLANWDYQQGEDSAAAAYYNAVWRNLLRLTFDELGEYFPDGGDRWFEVVRSLLGDPKSPWWDDKGTSAVETRDDILARAQDAAVAELTEAQGDSPTGWRWGAMHTLTPTHATFGESGIGPIEWLFNRDAQPVSGGDSIVNATGWTAGKGYQVDAVPSMRMIVDLSRLDESRWVQLTGNSGHAFHANYGDQFELWRTGRNLPFRFERSSIEAEAKSTLVLKP